MSTAPKVYGCIANVAQAIAKTGIAKDRKNAQQGYSFRGIDDVYNRLAPLLAEHGLVIVPRILSRELVERTSKSGTAQFYVTVEAEFDFIAAEDGSKVTARTYGEAQDSGDKATNKAMSAAYKYAAFQTFCIPTSADNDADAHTPEPVRVTPPDDYEDWLITMETMAGEGVTALSKAWTDSPAIIRKYAHEHDRATWERIKARAVAGDKERAA